MLFRDGFTRKHSYVTITVAVRNNERDPITGLASSAFRFALAGRKSAGKCGSVSAATTPGTYTVVFTGTKMGMASTLTAKVRGVRLNAKPKLNVVAGEVSGAKPAIRFRTPTVASGSTDVMTPSAAR